MTTNINFWSYLVQFFLEREMFQINVVEKNKNTHFMYNNFFLKLCCLWYNVETYCRAKHVTDDNMVHTHCMLDT